MPNIRKQLLALATTLLCSTSLLAEDTRWYQIEVIVFGQNSQTFRDTESWPSDYRLPDDLNAVELLPPDNSTDGVPSAFSLIEETALQLKPEAERIADDGNLSLLLHLGWYQPGLAAEQAKGVRIQTIEVPAQDETQLATTDDSIDPPRMEGVLTLSLSRYLHMRADVLYREALEEQPETKADPPAFLDLFALSEQPAWLPESRWQIYRLEESRRMRSNELHYLDHPVMGMLVLITPL